MTSDPKTTAARHTMTNDHAPAYNAHAGHNMSDMPGNLIWATAYNLIAIPIAGGLLVRSGLDLPMSVGAIAMSLSTIIVAANAQLLRRLKLQRTH